MRHAKQLTHSFGLENQEHFVSTRNACKLCSPLGASIAFRGVEHCIPLIHGSQGCSTYIRRYVISHFKEPIDIASSNFSEESAIFGGGDNLKKALDNLNRQYEPEVIGIATTCLSETIGDDVGLYLDQYKKSKDKGQKIPVIVHASTPSYRGTHMEGFHEAVRATVEALAVGGPCDGSINLISGFLSSADLRHLKEIMTDFGIDFTLLPDYSETLDGESWADYQKLSSGGTSIVSIKRMGRAVTTIQLGHSLKGQKSAGRYLEEKLGVPLRTCGLPIGIGENDDFFETLGTMSGVETPEKYVKERNRLVDAYIDGHKYVFGKRAVLYGEADLVASIAAFLDEIGITPVLCATGAATGTLEATIKAAVRHATEDVRVVEETDFATIFEACEGLKPDVVIGNSKGYYLSRRLGVPLVRIGFPIHDRVGGQRILHLGYRGTQQLFDLIANALIEHQQECGPVGYSYM
jgi:nitrogenase molybdenum-iron protein NifN